jgi:hypothetical protein
MHAARDERQRVGAGAVQPLRVVDDAEHRSGGGGLGKQVQHRQREQPAIGDDRGSVTERAGPCGVLRRRESVDEVVQRSQQAVHPGERQVRLGLDPGALQDAHAVGEAGGMGEQRGLPDACLAAQHQRPALPAACRREDILDVRAFAPAAIQHGLIVGLVTSPIRRIAPGPTLNSPTNELKE